MSEDKQNEEKRRVSFHDEVLVRTISPPHDEDDDDRSLSDLFPMIEEDLISSSEDDILHRGSSPSKFSLDQIMDGIYSQALQDDKASTSYVDGKLSKLDEFEEEYAEMDFYLRLSYPHYYQFLRSHMITEPVGTELYTRQVKEFKESIVGCRQYPETYFEDLENTLLITSSYERENMDKK